MRIIIRHIWKTRLESYLYKFIFGCMDNYLDGRRRHLEADCSVFIKAIWPAFSRTKNSLLSHSRSDLRILSGHCSITYLTSRWDSIVRDYCRLHNDEGVVETIEHLLCTCLMLSHKRKVGNRNSNVSLTHWSRHHLQVCQRHSLARQITLLTTLSSIKLFFFFSLLIYLFYPKFVSFLPRMIEWIKGP